MTRPPAFTVNGQPISGALWGMVLKHVRGDKLEAGRVFYRAHIKQARNIPAWIRGGMKSAANGAPGYALMPCRDEYDNGGMVKAWIDTNVLKVTGVQQADVSVLISTLTDKMGMK